MRIWVQKSALIQKRTRPLKFGDLAEKSELNSVSDFSTEAGREPSSPRERGPPSARERGPSSPRGIPGTAHSGGDLQQTLQQHVTFEDARRAGQPLTSLGFFPQQNLLVRSLVSAVDSHF